jgi:gamma-glutamylcyclotransferase (GGCT)/AIG2-like uncharacterized protein YtfP
MKNQKFTYLFVYGTLLKDLNNGMSRFLQSNSEFIGNAFVVGRLYEIGWYPGVVLSYNPTEKVYGNIFKVKNTETVFKALDDYEGICGDNPKPYEYSRELTDAYLNDGTKIETWFYAYNHSTENLKQILSGNYLDKPN